jgi:hypothetical protein
LIYRVYVERKNENIREEDYEKKELRQFKDEYIERVINKEKLHAHVVRMNEVEIRKKKGFAYGPKMKRFNKKTNIKM